jgi:hypothetical protein
LPCHETSPPRMRIVSRSCVVARWCCGSAGCAGAAPVSWAWPTTRSSRCWARPGPSCSTTASSASSHSRVSCGSMSCCSMLPFPLVRRSGARAWRAPPSPCGASSPLGDRANQAARADRTSRRSRDPSYRARVRRGSQASGSLGECRGHQVELQKSGAVHGRFHGAAQQRRLVDLTCATIAAIRVPREFPNSRFEPDLPGARGPVFGSS